MSFEDVPVHQADPSSVVVSPKRQRTVVKEKPLTELIESIKEHGQLQPGVCHKHSDSIELIIGYRRLLACKAIGIPYLFILKEEIKDAYALYEMELHENLYRENLSWLDEVNAKNELVKLWQQTKGGAPGQRGKFNLRQGAEALGTSLGLLSEDIKLAQFAAEVPEVAKAKTKSEAKAVIKRIEGAVERNEQFTKAVEKAKTKVACSTTEPPANEDEAAKQAQECLLLEYNNRVLHGPMEELLTKFPDEHFDVVFFDPPWGVNFDSVAKEASSKSSYQDNLESVEEKLPSWLALIYSKMAKDSHLYLKFGITNYQLVYDALREAGFTTNGIPIVWYKKGAHRVRTPDKYPGRSYEPIAFAIKGSRDLILRGREDHITTSQTPRKLACEHRSATHPDVIIDLLRRSCKPGDKVLDPMAGSGAFGVACEHLKSQLLLDYTEIELDKASRDLAFKNLLAGYSALINEAQVEAEASQDFADDAYKNEKPGSAKWMQIWIARPDLHAQMTEWMQKGGK